ncbi:MAG: hypothetical protein LBK03_01435 [Bacteroidales bacterium]|jgi:hypothetical protein|nr:hypothetical protein [Bacteroidales bacterium]
MNKFITLLLLAVSLTGFAQKTPLRHYFGPYLQTGTLFSTPKMSRLSESKILTFTMNAGGCYQLEKKRFWFNIGLAYSYGMFRENSNNDDWMIMQNSASHAVFFKQLWHTHAIALPLQFGGICYQKNRFNFGCFGGIGIEFAFFYNMYREYRGDTYYEKNAEKHTIFEFVPLLFTGMTFNYAVTPDIVISFIPQLIVFKEIDLRIQALFKIGKAAQ